MINALVARRHGLCMLAAAGCFALAAGFGATLALAQGQPHMQAALDALREARRQLEAATADKGGHRKEAMALIDAAIYQVRQGIEAGAN
jgi:hypothetical protein